MLPADKPELCRTLVAQDLWHVRARSASCLAPSWSSTRDGHRGHERVHRHQETAAPVTSPAPRASRGPEAAPLASSAVRAGAARTLGRFGSLLRVSGAARPRDGPPLELVGSTANLLRPQRGAELHRQPRLAGGSTTSRTAYRSCIGGPTGAASRKWRALHERRPRGLQARARLRPRVGRVPAPRGPHGHGRRACGPSQRRAPHSRRVLHREPGAASGEDRAGGGAHRVGRASVGVRVLPLLPQHPGGLPGLQPGGPRARGRGGPPVQARRRHPWGDAASLLDDVRPSSACRPHGC